MYSGIQVHENELANLCARRGVRRLELFGSAATGKLNPATGDLDFLVDFEPASPGELADRYFGLLEDLQKLFGLPIDLVMTAAIKNPYFLQGIAPSRTLLYAA
jgi:predicted nucleotidyltransferase